MIVMSNEFRTRGSMPGATRSEIMVRSSAGTAMRIPPSNVTTVTIELQARVAQDAREKLRPNSEHCARLRGDDVHPRSAGDDADVEGDTARGVVQRVQTQGEPRELFDRADAVLGHAGVRSAARYVQREAA